MKAKGLLLLMIGLSCGLLAVGQEYDDVYYGAQDRALALANQRMKYTSAKRSLAGGSVYDLSENVYGNANQNPEYDNQVKANPTSANSKNQATSAYFNPNFAPRGVNQGEEGRYANNAWNNRAWRNAGLLGLPASAAMSYGLGAWGNMGWGWGGSSFYSPFSFGSGYSFGGFGSGFSPYFSTMWGSPSSLFWDNYYYGGGFGYPYYNNFYDPWGWGGGIAYVNVRTGRRGDVQSNANSNAFYNNDRDRNTLDALKNRNTISRQDDDYQYQNQQRQNSRNDDSFFRNDGFYGSPWGGGGGGTFGGGQPVLRSGAGSR